MEQLAYNLLYRWFVGLQPDDPVWVPTVFTKNRDRLLEGDIARAFLAEARQLADRHGLLSHEHFTVDGTLLEAWASQKSFQPKTAQDRRPPSDDDPSNPSINFRGERRSNATHRSVTDPDARLTRKSSNTAAILGYLGSVLMENRHGLVVATDVRAPGYEAEREAALALVAQLAPRAGRRTLGGDKGYDTDAFVAALRARGVTPHISPNVHKRRRRSAIDRRTTRHPGYAVSQRKRQGDRARAQAPASGAGDGGLGVHLHQCRAQPGASAHAAGRRGGAVRHAWLSPDPARPLGRPRP
jgi:hypothetical protein